ncbi:MAG: putative metallopeptidase [Candidatus Beckwithbacteria bacterium]|nr:metallopeptidase [Patescibacteria group bacterium]
MEFELAPDIQKKLIKIQKKLKLPNIKIDQIIAFRSYGSRARARARIWAFPKIWQMALKLDPHYCIEIISDKFDHLKEDDKIRILIHELMHIPSNFSGALLPHRGRGRVVINARSVEQMFKEYKTTCKDSPCR